MNGSGNRAQVEVLENRQLLAATLPNALGDFTGNVVYSGGTATIMLDITKQKGGALSGVGALSTVSNTGKIHGSINKNGIVRLSTSAKKFSATFVGTLSGNSLDGILTYHSGKSHGTGTVTTSRA
jgi:hypothetical protein